MKEEERLVPAEIEENKEGDLKNKEQIHKAEQARARSLHMAPDHRCLEY